MSITLAKNNEQTPKVQQELKNETIDSSKIPSKSAVKCQFGDMVGKSLPMQKIFKIIKKVAATESTVLITGESGTGKELIARAIHKNSKRAHTPMVVINCGAIPGELLESELFGHEKGSFTGANRTRIGRFEMADGGTIFLDEIGDMSPDLQVKLLRAVQEQSFERVGGTSSISVDIRIISATNKDLVNSIKEGKFREDLYYRLNVIPITVPALRKRKDDIPLLIDFFMERLAKRIEQPIKSFSDRSRELLKNYQWPGNIRELENMMERLSVLVDDDIIVPDDLPEHINNQQIKSTSYILPFLDNGMGFNEAIEQHQRALILHALHKTNWIKAKAAAMLKMNRTTLVEKIKKMNIEDERDDFDNEILNFSIDV